MSQTRSDNVLSRPWPRMWLSLMAVPIVLATSVAWTQDSPLDFRSSAPPLVIIAMDTSGSMEWINKDEVPPCCARLPLSDPIACPSALPGCDSAYTAGVCENPAYNSVPNVDYAMALAANDPDVTWVKSRDALAKEVLTGRFTDYWCGEMSRSRPQTGCGTGNCFPIDDWYPVPHLQPRYRSKIRETGLIRLNRDLVRFGYVSFDSDPVVGALAQEWSFTSSSETYWNLGMRGFAARLSPSVDVGDLDDPAVARSVAADVERSVDQSIPYGGTPLGPLFRDLSYYFQSAPNILADSFSACRDKHIILVTDGSPSRDDCSPGMPSDLLDLPKCHLDQGDLTSVKYPYGTTLEELATMRAMDPDIRVHVIGFNLPNDNRPCRGAGSVLVAPDLPGDRATVACIHQMAFVGGTDADEDPTNNAAAYIAENQIQLTQALSKVLNSIVDNASSTSSRTKTAVTNRTLFRVDKSTQYQFSAGFTVDPEFHLWRGVVERREIDPCGNDPLKFIHYEDALAGLTNFTTRKILTPLFDESNTTDNVEDSYYTNGVDATVNPVPGLDVRLIDLNELDSASPPVLSPVLNNGIRDITFTSGGFRGTDFHEIVQILNGAHDVRNHVDLDPKKRRVLGDVFHASPVAVGGPDLDLEIVSYKAFAAAFGDIAITDSDITKPRATTLLVGSNDGMLHAFNGEYDPGETSSRDNTTVEFWSFLPQVLQSRVYLQRAARIYGVDATPVVRDLRVYRGDDLPGGYFDPTGASVTAGGAADVWSTVVVGGLRSGGRAYYALEMSDPTKPHFLWELNPVTEAKRFSVHDITHNPYLDSAVGVAGDDQPGESVLGLTYAQPGVGTARIYNSTTTKYEEKGIAILPAGMVVDPSAPGEIGQGIYVVELMTGQIIRRFRKFKGGADIDAPVTGSVGVFDDFPGSLITRAFMGDAIGRLLRVDMRDPDPANWFVSVFHDSLTNRPVMFKPAIALDQAGHVVVVYGTGDVDRLEVKARDAGGALVPNGVWSLTETATIAGDGTISGDYSSTLNWELTFPDEGEKLTGAPVIFNKSAFFSTFVPNQTDVCGQGHGRVWGLDYLEHGATTSDVIGRIPTLGGVVGQISKDVDDKFLELSSAAAGDAPTVIFGVTIAKRPSCIDSTTDPAKPSVSSADADGGGLELVVQTGRTNVNGGSEGAAGSDLNVYRFQLPKVQSAIFPSSWTVVLD